MKFDEKKDAIKHLKFILGDACTVEDNGMEVLIYGADVESAYMYMTGNSEEVKMRLIYKIKLDELGRYWETFLNRNGSFVKLSG